MNEPERTPSPRQKLFRQNHLCLGGQGRTAKTGKSRAGRQKWETLQDLLHRDQYRPEG